MISWNRPHPKFRLQGNMTCGLALPGLPHQSFANETPAYHPGTFCHRRDPGTTLADRWVQKVRNDLQKGIRHRVALSGGRVAAVFQRHAAAAFATAPVNWQQIDFFWGDERCVPPDHADSNFRAAREALLDPAGVPLSQIHRLRGSFSQPKPPQSPPTSCGHSVRRTAKDGPSLTSSCSVWAKTAISPPCSPTPRPRIPAAQPGWSP